MTTSSPDVWRYPYVPTTRQAEAHRLTTDELLYGGAAGGGKTDMLLASAVTMCLLVPGANVVVFRRTFPDLNRHIIPHLLRRIPQPTVATYNAGDHMWRFRNGSVLELAHLTRDSDVLKYQGAEYQLICWDELTQFTWYSYDYLGSRLRAAGDVASAMAALGLRPRMLGATNPGGPGHHWVKARWVDPAPPGRVWRPPPTEDEPHPGTRVYIPARVTDNPHVDAAYENRLAGIADPNLRRALLDGDWDILEGVRFAGWRRDVHVIEPELFPVPAGAGVVRAVGVDYGLEAPFCALWGANLADGLVVIYRELYTPGLTAREQADAIKEAEAPGERGPGRPIPVALDPASWARSPHQARSKLSALRPGEDAPVGSIAHAYRQVLGGAVHKARNERLAGAQLVDAKLKVRVDGPRLLVYSTCRHLIRTLPALPRARRNPEDVDCFVAGTMIDTPGGVRPVEDLRPGDLVCTPMGPQRVLKAGPEGHVSVARVALSDGTVLVGTADHEVVTSRGLVQLRALNTTDEVVTRAAVESEGTWAPATRSFTAASPTGANPAGPTTSRPPGPSAATAGHHYTATSTPITTVPSRTTGMSTTSTRTPRTTTPQTSRSSAQPSMLATITRSAPSIWLSVAAPGRRQTRPERSSEPQSPRPAPTHQRESNRAQVVAALSSPASTLTSTAPRSAATTPGGGPTTCAPALSAGTDSVASRPGGTSLRPAPTHVDGSFGVATVYTLTVDGCGLYYANGALVTNTTAEDHSYDALRYLLMELEGRSPQSPNPIRDRETRGGLRPATAGLGTAGF